MPFNDNDPNEGNDRGDIGDDNNKKDNHLDLENNGSDQGAMGLKKDIRQPLLH